jgi:hypothetical protein
MAKANMIGRTAPNGDEVWIVGTPHFLESWNAKRYGKSRTATLTDQLGSWTYPPKNGFYEAMLDAPIDQTYYAVVRKRSGLKPIAFIYFRNINNGIRGGRRELELISVTPPIRGQTEGINLETFHDHAETEEWVQSNWRY